MDYHSSKARKALVQNIGKNPRKHDSIHPTIVLVRAEV